MGQRVARSKFESPGSLAAVCNACLRCGKSGEGAGDIRSTGKRTEGCDFALAVDRHVRPRVIERFDTVEWHSTSGHRVYGAGGAYEGPHIPARSTKRRCHSASARRVVSDSAPSSEAVLLCCLQSIDEPPPRPEYRHTR